MTREKRMNKTCPERRQKARGEWLPHSSTHNAEDYKKAKIELRSEKVRNIIGQVPPALLRYGIVITGISLLLLAAVSAFIPYQPGIDMEITVSQDTNGLLSFTATIPQEAMKKKAKFLEVVAGTAIELSLPTNYQIESISDTVNVSGQKMWRTITLNPKGKIPATLQIKNPVKMPGKLLLNKQTVMMWLVGKVLE